MIMSVMDFIKFNHHVSDFSESIILLLDYIFYIKYLNYN